MKYQTQTDYYREPRDFDNDTPREILQYAVGALLYMPANKDIADKIIDGRVDFKSICLDLEDSVGDDGVEMATQQLRETMLKLSSANIELPLIFIRVRTPEQLVTLSDQLAEDGTLDILTGFNFPKFDSSNASDYVDHMLQLNEGRTRPIYINPIIESEAVMERTTRNRELREIRRQLSRATEYVLNVRVGATDFCNIFAIRRKLTQNVYQIGVVADAFSDIINALGKNYVVSGPVWEYFGTPQAEEGLLKELELDRLNGFHGKTSIHPYQLNIINSFYVVDYEDYESALTILGMNPNVIGVANGNGKMNETKTHINWAKRTVGIAEIYGVHPQYESN